MPETQTLEFENARALGALYANDLQLLKSLEKSLNVKVTTRDGWLRLEGEQPGIERARRVFEQLENVRKSGVDIRQHEFNYALRSVTEQPQSGKGDGGLETLVDTRIAVSPRR